MSALPRYDDGFFDAEERALGDRFLEAGYLILPAEDRRALDRIRDRAAAIAAAKLGVEAGDPDRFLNRIHERVDAAGLNELRLAVIDGLNAEPWLRPSYHRLARRALAAVVGNELAMQRRLNLSIQMPHDASSLLPVHADSWDGDSPFEVVLWVPLVDCRRTKSMFLVPPEKGRAVEAGFRRFDGGSTEDLFRAVEPDALWLEAPYGSVLLFSQNLMHGNRVNRETETRWSMNCRFKSLLSPYAGKRLGEFFEPVTLRPATRLGMDYEFPEGFDE